MKQIKILTIFILSGILIISCSKKHQVSAEIDGLGNDTVIVTYVPLSKLYQMDEPFQDTIISINDKFIFNLPAKEPVFAIIFPKKGGFKRVNGSAYFPRHKYLNLLLKPDDIISVKGKLHKYYLEYEAIGSEFNEEFSQIRKGYIKKTSQAAKIELELDTLMSQKGDKELINNLFKKRNEINGISREEQFKYIKGNWDKELSAYYLTQQRLDTIAKYYENLSTVVREGIFKNVLTYKLLKYQKNIKVREAEKNIVEGNFAPDFCLRSLSSSDFELNSINGKYVVLDFWGSWCGWCIKGFPKMKKYYEKYKNQIEIVGIACNDTEEKWKKSIKENNLNWLHVINDKDINRDVSVMYGIQGYPTKFILDKNKKILAKFVGESEAFYKKIDELMKN
jgi:thiol-disulfide isomerase/thioredoxin